MKQSVVPPQATVRVSAAASKMQRMRQLMQPRPRQEPMTAASSSAQAACSSSEAASQLPSDKPPAEREKEWRAGFDADFAAYMSEDAIDDSCDPLSWWRTTGQKFKFLLPLAQKYMTPLATSAIVEGCFSKAKRWCSDQRSCISDLRFDVLTTLGSVLATKTESELDELLTVGARSTYRCRLGEAAEPDAEFLTVEYEEEEGLPKDDDDAGEASEVEPDTPPQRPDGLSSRDVIDV